MHHSWKYAVAVAVLVLNCRASMAEEIFKYNFLGAGYARSTFESKGMPNMHAFANGIFGAYAVHDLVAIGVGYTKTTINSVNGSISGISFSTPSVAADSVNVGMKLHKMIVNNIELGFALNRNRTTSESYTILVGGTPYLFPSTTDYSNDFGLSATIALVPEFKLSGSLGRSTGGNTSVNDNYSVDAEYDITGNVGIKAGYHLSGSNNSSGSRDYARGFSIEGIYYY